jgi:hypothetical protein
MVTCQLCERSFPRDRCHIIVPTTQERAHIEQQGGEPLDEYTYCQPCWKSLSNPVTGPAIMRGLFERRLRLLGVSNAEDLANRYHGELIKRATKPRS